jgi:hypothetical protein
MEAVGCRATHIESKSVLRPHLWSDILDTGRIE